MKYMKKLAAVLLAAVMAMSLLTACGGGGGGSSSGKVDSMDKLINFTGAELTQKINTDMNSNAQYDENLGDRFAVAMNAAMSATEGFTNEAQAEQVANSILASAGFDANTEIASTIIQQGAEVNIVASGLESSIRSNNVSLNNKTIGYAAAPLKGNGNYYLFFAIVQ